MSDRAPDDTKPVVLEELAYASVKNHLIAQARARRDISHAIHDFLLRYELIYLFQKCRENRVHTFRDAFKPRKTLAERLKASYGIE